MIAKLGQGARGEVYRAEDIHLHRPVALKFLARPENEQEREELLREARLCSALLHPNIAVIYEVGWEEDVPFFAMELVEGATLSKRVREQKISRVQAIRYTKQMLEALDEAHSHGIVHRDIKSSNIIVTRRDSIKVLDFGLARVVTSNAGDEKAEGTLEFFSPEQARGESVDLRSDLFSAGVVLYHMLSGRLPFERSTAVATYRAILSDPVPPLGISDTLDAILQKALAKDPAERFQTAQAFLDELDTVDFIEKPRAVIAGLLTIAVLYFDRIGEQEESEYLRLGITEDIITDLSKVGGVRVLSRHAVQKYKDKSVDLATVVADLQAHYILRGTVQKVEDRIRVSAQLMETGSEAPVWSEKYDREIKDIFALQDDVARSITSALKIRLTDSEQRSIRQRSTADLKAYEYFLRSKHYYNHSSEENNRAAEQLLLQTVKIDPQFAAAHAALAEVYVQRFYNWYDRDRVWLKKASEIIDVAYQLNDQLPEVHCTMGQLLYLGGKYEEAMDEVQKAIRLDPHYALAHDHTGEIYLHMGKLDQAVLAFHTEMRLSPEVIYPYFYLVWIHSLMGDFRVAREVLQKARSKHASNPLLHVLEGVSASYSDDYSRAEENLGMALKRNSGNSFALGRLSVVYAQQQRWREAIDAAERATEVIDPMDHHAAFDRACVMALRPDPGQCFEWLNRAIDLGWRCLYHFQNDRNLATVRDLPEFRKILERLS